MNRFRVLMWLFAIVFISVLSGCDLELEDLDLDELSIAASDQFDIEAGTYTIEYTIQDLNWYLSNYDIEVVIEAFDQNDEPVEVVDDTIVVHEGDVYAVTIFVYDRLTEEIVAEKTVTITAIFAESLEVTILPDRLVYEEGDLFDPTGMVVSLVYSNGNEKIVEDYVFNEELLTLDDASFSISYDDFVAFIELVITGDAIESLEVTTLPDRLVYEEGDYFDPTGMVVSLVYSSGNELVIENYSFNEEALTLDDASFSISYGDFEAFIELEITPSVIETLDAPYNLMIWYGLDLMFMADENAESFELRINDESHVIDSMYVDLSQYLTEEIVYDIRIKARAEGFNDSDFSETLQISMVPVSIKLESEPRMQYIEGDHLAVDEIVVIVVFGDGREAFLDPLDYAFSHTGPLTVDIKEIVVTANNGFETSFPIEVVSNEIYWEVIFDGNGGSLVSGEEVQLVRHGEGAVAPVYTHKTLVFLGFDQGFNVVESNLTIAAQWFDPEAGTDGLLYEPVYDAYYQPIHYEINGYSGFEPHVIIPDTYQGLAVKGIKSQAFINNQVIETINVSRTIESIGWHAFFGMGKLRDILVSHDNPVYASNNGNLYDKSLTRLLLVAPMKTGTLFIPDGVESIDSYAVSHANHIDEIVIPASVHDIGTDAFKNTAWYQNQDDGLVYAGNVLYAYKGTMPEDLVLVLDEETVGIAGEAFAFQENLIQIELPYGLKTIGAQAFLQNTGLTQIAIPATVQRINHATFNGASNLEHIFLPDEVYDIASSAFNGTKWQTIQPDGVVYIGKVALYLNVDPYFHPDIILKEGTIAIADSAFANYSLFHELKNVYIPNTVNYIGVNAFSSNHGLTMVHLPESVIQIGSHAFSDNINLTLYVDVIEDGDNWDENWNPDPRPVIYGSDQAPVSIDYIIEFGEIHDPVTIFTPFLSHIPEFYIPGINVINLYETPDFSGDPIDFPYISQNKQSVTLYAEFDAAVHTVTFNVTEGFEWIDGGPLEQFIVHGQPLENPPVLFMEGETFFGWNENLLMIESDLDLFPLHGRISISEDTRMSGVNKSYWIRVISSDVPIEINLRVNDWGYDYFEYDHGSSFSIRQNTTISARVEYMGEWIDLDDVVIDDIDHTMPSTPMIYYYSDMDNPGNLLVRLYSGTKPDGAVAPVSHTLYRLNHAETWETFTGSLLTLSVPNGTIIAAQTYDTNDQPSNRLTISATLESLTYEIGEKTTERYVLQITEHFPNGIKTVRTELIGSIVQVEGTNIGEFHVFYPHRTGSSYIGCGPKAAEIFLGWFGSEKTQFDLVYQFYIRVQAVSFFTDIFTTPAQLEFGIARAMSEYGFSDYDVHRRSTNTTNPTVNLIESFLENGFPVIILVDEGDHYQVISSSTVTWSETGSVLHAEFRLHDNGGRFNKTWPQVEYFFEDQWSAVVARALGYSSYRDMILSIKIHEE